MAYLHVISLRPAIASQQDVVHSFLLSWLLLGQVIGAKF